MAKSHKKHLAEHDYEGSEVDMLYDPEVTQEMYARLVAKYGEDNVWDSRILDKVFDTSEASFQYGMLVGVVHITSGRHGSLLSTIDMPSCPKFYYGFERMA